MIKKKNKNKQNLFYTSLQMIWLQTMQLKNSVTIQKVDLGHIMSDL